MELLLVGLPGAGKSAVGRELARRHGAELVDLDERIETDARMRISGIFAAEGEAGFRRRERAAVRALGSADRLPGLRRILVAGAGAVVDPRNRSLLYRERLTVHLDVAPSLAAARLRAGPPVRPLLDDADPELMLAALARERERFYAAGIGVPADGDVTSVASRIESLLERGVDAGSLLLLRDRNPLGELIVGERIAARELGAALRRFGARRAIVVSEPVAWELHGASLSERLADEGLPVETILLPSGEEAKRLSVVETAARELARRRVGRDETLVALGGGALTDVAGFVAASYLRGISAVLVPTTLAGMIDAAIGGKTGVNLPEGKNLVGAFHPPAAVIADVSLLHTLPACERRAALGEAVKMAIIGDEPLFELLETQGLAIIEGDPGSTDALAELVERCALGKLAVIEADERELLPTEGRVTLNLGHTLAHALEAADGYTSLAHGEAVGYGLRAAVLIGAELGVTPPDRAARILALLAQLGLGSDSLGLPTESILAALANDKKQIGGRLRYVLPDATGVLVRDDVPTELIARTTERIVEGVAP